jgi:hypothetical protein
MWSLPDINRMNARAAASQRRLTHEARLKTPSRKFPCECCHEPSVHHWPWYDIFSDDIKGVTHLCEEHYQDGRGDEEFFECDSCGRRMIDHITWERYSVNVGDQTLCLKCAAEEHFSDSDNWIDPRAVKQVVLVPCDDRRNGENVPLFDPATGVLNVARCRHVLGVKQPVTAGIRFVDNFEFDSMDGHQISGVNMLDTIRSLSVPFCAVLDAAYQFAVSVGFYIKADLNGTLFTRPDDSRRLPITFSKRTNLPRWAGITLDPGWEKGSLCIEGKLLQPVEAA